MGVKNKAALMLTEDATLSHGQKEQETRWLSVCLDGRKQEPRISARNRRHCQLHMHLVQSMRNDCGLRADSTSDK